MRTRARIAALVAATAAVALAACGGKGKGKTTPEDKAPLTRTNATPEDPYGADGGDAAAGAGGGSGASDGSGGGSAAKPDAPAVVLPPNLDPDPKQAKARVDQHLAVARSALALASPDADTALREARLALQLDASNVDAAAMVAFAYYHKRLYDTAELVLDDLFKRDAAKRNANVYYVYGLVYDRTDRPERALAAYRKALELEPSHASALVNLGVHQLRNSRYADAQVTFERLTRQFSRTDAVTMTSLGSAYRGRSADYRPGDSERDQFVRVAEAAYKRALQANARYGPAYYNLGLLYLDTDPFPGVPDTLQRLNAAKAYFEQYKSTPGADLKLYDGRMKDVDRAIKRATKKRKSS